MCVVAREVEKHAARMPYMGHGRKPLRPPDGERPKPLSITAHGQVSLGRIHRSGESDAAAIAIRTRVCFLIQFFSSARRQACNGARTDYTNRPCKKFKDTKGSCQSVRAVFCTRFLSCSGECQRSNYNGTNEALLFSHLLK